MSFYEIVPEAGAASQSSAYRTAGPVVLENEHVRLEVCEDSNIVIFVVLLLLSFLLFCCYFCCFVVIVTVIVIVIVIFIVIVIVFIVTVIVFIVIVTVIALENENARIEVCEDSGHICKLMYKASCQCDNNTATIMTTTVITTTIMTTPVITTVITILITTAITTMQQQ